MLEYTFIVGRHSSGPPDNAYTGNQEKLNILSQNITVLTCALK